MAAPMQLAAIMTEDDRLMTAFSGISNIIQMMHGSERDIQI